MNTFRLEMRVGQDFRQVEADGFEQTGSWLIFYRQPAIGGRPREYWRVQQSDVISMEIKP